MFRRRSGPLLNVLCTFNLHPLSTNMTVLYGNDAFSNSVLSTKKRYFEKRFRFPENLFQSESIEIVQIFH